MSDLTNLPAALLLLFAISILYNRAVVWTQGANLRDLTWLMVVVGVSYVIGVGALFGVLSLQTAAVLFCMFAAAGTPMAVFAIGREVERRRAQDEIDLSVLARLDELDDLEAEHHGAQATEAGRRVHMARGNRPRSRQGWRFD